jgi:hypothetical protein
MTNDREAVIKAYQADLAKKGLYKGESTGRRAAALGAAIHACIDNRCALTAD